MKILNLPVLRVLSGVLLAGVLVGCATLPPSRSVSNLQELAGKWEGTARTGGGNTLAVKNMMIRSDGTWELDLPGASPSHHTGAFRLADGKLRSHSNTSGNDSTWTLHEGDGKRVLRWVNDDGRVTGEVVPVKP